jgi:tetratricopeptide (TPR) repeat protein
MAIVSWYDKGMSPFQPRRSKRTTRRRTKQFLLGRLYLGLPSQYATTIISAILLSAFVFSGFLLFRYSDTQDLLNRGRKQMAQGKMAWAAKTLENLVNHNPEHMEAHLLLGQAYLQLGERKKAEQQFLSANALQNKTGTPATGPEAGLALGKLAMSRKHYAEAETQFLKMAKTHPKNTEVRQALFDLYRDWGDRLVEDAKPLQEPINKYELAWTYVTDYEQQSRLKSSWLAVLRQYVEQQTKQRHYDPAIKTLERAIKLNYDAELLVQVAGIYEKKNDIEHAITWYRKAYASNPALVGVKLSTLLLKKGEGLAKAGKTAEAEALFAEAKKVSKTASIPLDVLFPLKVTDVKLTYENNLTTDEVQPVLNATFANSAKGKALNFLVARVQFFANDQMVSEVKLPVASPDSPLAENETRRKPLVFKPAESLNLYQLEGKPLVARLSVAYHEGETPNWKQLRAEEVLVQRSTPTTVQENNPNPPQ